ncbi:type II secretion system F family protein [Candidatus Woesearchaeota archaeon]|nr:type II secretion system F family protein [Candidatus Woesearchaeota archaeon]
MIKIPYAVVPAQVLLRWAKKIGGITEKLRLIFPKLSLDLKYSESEVSDRDYLGMCLIASGIIFVFFFLLVFLLLTRLQLKGFFVYALIASLVITLFIFIQQISYPRLFVSRRVRSIEQNLMPALQNILIQINSGVPLFDTLVNISFGGYGEISNEFKRGVKRIAAGEDEITALEDLAKKNSSVFFRRSIWQLVNGMKAGSDISNVIKNITENLGEEQLIGIQRYGSQLNPLAMFYMLFAVIMPSLGITFIIVLSSFISLGESVTKSVLYGLTTVVIFFQIMFMGMIKARRPNLMQ